MVSAIFRNLLSNAIKFTKTGGIITVESHDAGDFREIAVVDTGVGMSTNKQHKLFNIGEGRISQRLARLVNEARDWLDLVQRIR